MIEARAQVQFGFVVVFVIGILLIWPAVKKKIEEYIPIRYVQVEGAFQYIDKDDIKMKINPLVQEGYFSVDIQARFQSVMSLPWTEKVQVERIWPDRVKLRIYEQKPVVRWQAHSLLNVHGDIFRPVNIDKFESLAVLYAPIDQRKQWLDVMDGLSVNLMDQGLHLTKFRVTERQSWLLGMDNGMSIQLGRFQPLQKFTQLMKAFVVSGSDLVSKIAYVDMRYPNGYAVRWRENEQINW